MRAKLLASAMKDAQDRAKAITEAVGGHILFNIYFLIYYKKQIYNIIYII
jgi:formate-dependent phosphoribosylglycinamide formyltransferase (GAR transformylase)